MTEFDVADSCFGDRILEAAVVHLLEGDLPERGVGAADVGYLAGEFIEGSALLGEDPAAQLEALVGCRSQER